MDCLTQRESVHFPRKNSVTKQFKLTTRLQYFTSALHCKHNQQAIEMMIDHFVHCSKMISLFQQIILLKLKTTVNLERIYIILTFSKSVYNFLKPYVGSFILLLAEIKVTLDVSSQIMESLVTSAHTFDIFYTKIYFHDSCNLIFLFHILG